MQSNGSQLDQSHDTAQDTASGRASWLNKSSKSYDSTLTPYIVPSTKNKLK